MERHNWIELDPSSLRRRIRSGIQGVQVDVFLSPYDIPEAVRGNYDEEKGKLVIEFKYFGEEPTKAKPADHMELFVGKNSGRLYRIEIDVKSLGVEAVGLTVYGKLEQALDNLVHDPIKKDRIENYRLVKDVIAQKQKELFELSSQ